MIQNKALIVAVNTEYCLVSGTSTVLSVIISYTSAHVIIIYESGQQPALFTFSGWIPTADAY